MKTHTFNGLDDFARRSAHEAAKATRVVGSAAIQEIGKRFHAYAVPITPIGGIFTKDRHPGLMKRSWQMGGGSDLRATLGNTAPYATIIDRGRKRGVTPIGASKIPGFKRKHRKGKANKQAKMMGSKQAPQGITRPVWKRIRGEHDSIVRTAISRAES